MSQTPASKPSRWMVVLRITLVYVGIVLVLELCGQVAIRVLEARHETAAESDGLLAYDTPLIGFFLKQALKLDMGLWKVTTNHWGFRDGNNFPLTKQAGEIRIAVVGGSTVFGWGVQDNESVPAHLQTLIDSYLSQMHGGNPKRVRVINAGCPWYASWHEAALIYFKILEFSPDWIIVMDGLNDTAQALAPAWTPIVDGYSDMPTKLSAERRKAGGAMNQILASIIDVSPTLRYVHARLKAKEQMRTGAYHPQVWDQYVTYMTRVKHLTDSLGVRLSFYYQPVMHVDKPLDIFETLHDGTSMTQPEFAATFRKLYIEGETRLLAEPTLGVTSLRKVFARLKDPIYLDGLHYNARGNLILAQAIFNHEVKKTLPTLLASPFASNP